MRYVKKKNKTYTHTPITVYFKSVMSDKMSLILNPCGLAYTRWNWFVELYVARSACREKKRCQKGWCKARQQQNFINRLLAQCVRLLWILWGKLLPFVLSFILHCFGNIWITTLSFGPGIWPVKLKLVRGYFERAKSHICSTLEKRQKLSLRWNGLLQNDEIHFC